MLIDGRTVGKLGLCGSERKYILGIEFEEFEFNYVRAKHDNTESRRNFSNEANLTVYSDSRSYSNKVSFTPL